MAARLEPRLDCDGHHGSGTIVLEYAFPSGVQQPQHPTPGAPYGGTSRQCFLPYDAVGLQCLSLLASAFQQGALFRVGKSGTTGRDGVVVWAIHQKSAPNGGSVNHGWPDDGYLQRLKSECAAAGVHGVLELS